METMAGSGDQLFLVAAGTFHCWPCGGGGVVCAFAAAGDRGVEKSSASRARIAAGVLTHVWRLCPVWVGDGVDYGAGKRLCRSRHGGRGRRRDGRLATPAGDDQQSKG